MEKIETLSDREVVSGTKDLRGREKRILHEMLRYIGEMDERKLFRAEGYPSMYSFLKEGCGYSEGGACRRIKVARCMRRYPEVYEALKNGELSLSTACELAKGVEGKDFPQMVEKAKGKSVEEVAHLVARPSEKKRAESVRVVRKRAPQPREEEDSLFSARGDKSTAKTAVKEEEAPVSYSLSLEVDEEFMRLYREAKALGGGSSMKEVFEKTLKEYTERHSPKERQKRREKRAAKAVQPAKRTRHIPRAVRDEVSIRDEGQCTFVSEAGVRCCAKEFLEYDHIEPFLRGGNHAASNIRLRCKGHNLMEAEEVFGKEFIRSFGSS